MNGQDVILETQADVDAFDPNVTVVEGNLIIGRLEGDFGSDLIDLSNLQAIEKIAGNLTIRKCSSLLNLNGLSNIESIEGDLDLILLNSLVDLDGLLNLNTVGGDFKIFFNWNSEYRWLNKLKLYWRFFAVFA